ncbi:hypothetical protein BGX28_001454 [Mortierella sp. GBA30]|nr:hypothetical protein BGX28_001454 [Mortierella sp. GBA30]
MPPSNNQTTGDQPTGNQTTSMNCTGVLNYALNLGRMEAAFFKQGLSKFNANSFTQAGFDSKARDQLALIGQHANDHTSAISQALNMSDNNSGSSCNYNFPMGNVSEFLMSARALENAAVSASLGVLSLAGLKGDSLTGAASILAVGARQAAYLNMLFNQTAFPYAYDTPLTPRQVITLASPFMKSCSSSNDTSMMPYPALNATLQTGNTGNNTGNNPGNNTGNSNSTRVITWFEGPNNSTNNTYCQFLYGNKTAVSPRNQCNLPSDVTGYVYVLISNTSAPLNRMNQNQILAGPAMLFNDVPNNSTNSNNNNTSGTM